MSKEEPGIMEREKRVVERKLTAAKHKEKCADGNVNTECQLCKPGKVLGNHRSN